MLSKSSNFTSLKPPHSGKCDVKYRKLKSISELFVMGVPLGVEGVEGFFEIVFFLRIEDSLGFFLGFGISFAELKVRECYKDDLL
jgi:hypothetical protein